MSDPNWKSVSDGFAGDVYAFRPDTGRASVVDRRVRASYADSIAQLLGAFEGQGAIAAGTAAAVAQRVRRERVSPGTIAAYADLMEATFSDRADDAARALDCLVRSAERPGGDDLRFVTLDDRVLGPGQSRRYLWVLDDDPASPLSVTRLSAAELAASEGVARATLALLDEAVPELAGEVRALVREILLVRSAPGSPSDFHGASAYLFWGGLLINGPYHRTRPGLAQALAHESGHSLLFGLNLGAPLVENDPGERHASPLRDDPRPMEGIVHATYVVARMHYCMARLLEWPGLSLEEREEATRAKAAHERAFSEGAERIGRFARFTPGGRAAFEPALRYMTGMSR